MYAIKTALGKCLLVTAMAVMAACSNAAERPAKPAPSTEVVRIGSPVTPATSPQPTTASTKELVVDVQPSAPVMKPIAPQAKGTSPNVLLITIDTLRADHVGAYGSLVKTPTLDALARQGVRFNTAITQFSQTNPSHATIFTGTYPSTHKVKVHGLDMIAPSATTMAEALAGYGYTTAAIYDWPSFDPDLSGFDRGFGSYQAVYFPVQGMEDSDDIWRKYTGRADVTTDAILKWAGGKPSSPYFLWVHFQDPHYPFDSPPPFNRMYDPDCEDCDYNGWEWVDRIFSGASLSKSEIDHVVTAYDGAISFTDQQIGRMMDGLRAANMLDNTLVVVISDHGEAFDENGKWFHPYVLYNTVLRVPLIVVYPQSVPQGIVVEALAQGVDVLPTVLDIVGAPFPEGIEGKSLVPLIQGKENGEDRVAFTQVPDDSAIAMTTRDWKLIRNNTTGSLELYDLRKDPQELTDLSTTNPQQAADLESVLKTWMSDHGIGR